MPPGMFGGCCRYDKKFRPEDRTVVGELNVKLVVRQKPLHRLCAPEVLSDNKGMVAGGLDKIPERRDG